MNVKNTPINDLKPYAHNPKTHPSEQVERISRSIEEFGFLVPVLIDADNSIIAGHGRLLAARKLGLDQIPTIRIDHLTDSQIRAYRIADNRLTESAWDLDMLESEIDILHDMDFDIDLTGFDDVEIGEMFPRDPEPEGFDAETAMDDESVPLVQAGELWILGDHRLLCGDSTKSEDVERLMDGERADMVFTDPPYGMNLDTDWSDAVGSLKSIGKKQGTVGNKYNPVIGDDIEFDPGELMNIFKYCKEQFWFGADYYAERLIDKNNGSWLVWDKRKETQSEAIGSEFELIWSKTKHKRRMLRHDWFGFLSSDNAKEAQNRMHPTQKPTSLICDVFSQWGKADDIVLDLFGGSGSTLIACEQLNRRCYMMELDPHYCGVILDRWANYAKEDPIRDDGMLWSELKAQQL